MHSKATLVLANHRPESIDAATELMQRHDAVILEEPPDELFPHMLTGKMSISSYLETLDVEYPEFSRRMSSVLRRLHTAGKRLVQVEPFLEGLLQIHSLFADGGSPADIKPGSTLFAIYDAERSATAALLDFYRVAVNGHFEAAVEAVKHFSRTDARRFMLRDKMRAEALSQVLTGAGSWYIEAGPIHYPLWAQLKRRLPEGYPLKVKFLMADAVRAMGYRDHTYGPGDLLTLLHRFHPNSSDPREDLLAARTLVYNKMIAKEEIVDSADPFPHTRDELRTAAIVRQLTIADCRRLFPFVRRATTESAREMVQHYLERKSAANDLHDSRASGESLPAAG